MIPIDDIRAAARRIAGAVHRTPLFHSHSLGEMAGVELFLKCENLQKTGSFKPRGALNKALSLEPFERDRGLITVSAGNHAQAVAWAAKQLNAPCVVVMPEDAPRAKLDAVRGYGAEVVLHADRPTLFDRLRQVESERGMTFVHPFDDPDGLAGAGTCGLEIAEDLPDVDVVVVPVGGGGLMAGVASAIEQLCPNARVVAVDLQEGPGLEPSLAAGRSIPVTRPPSIADGMTAPFIGTRPLEVAREAVDQIAMVAEFEIVGAMELLFTRAKLVAEGAGAAATAALLAGKVEVEKGARVVAIVSGGNVDPERMHAALEKYQRGELSWQ